MKNKQPRKKAITKTEKKKKRMVNINESFLCGEGKYFMTASCLILNALHRRVTSGGKEKWYDGVKMLMERKNDAAHTPSLVRLLTGVSRGTKPPPRHPHQQGQLRPWSWSRGAARGWGCVCEVDFSSINIFTSLYQFTFSSPEFTWRCTAFRDQTGSHRVSINVTEEQRFC